MAHFRRKKIRSRRINKRLTSKRTRAAEVQAFNGAKPRRVHGMGWSDVIKAQPPLLQEVATGHPKRRDPEKSTYRRRYRTPCPVTGWRHVYLSDTERIVVILWNGTEYIHERKFKLCVECGHETTFRYRKGKMHF